MTVFAVSSVKRVAASGLSGFLLLFAQADPTRAQPMTPPESMSKSEHGYHHAFDDPERWVKEFDDPARDVWQKPEEIIDALQIEPSARVADIGAGTGYFSVRIAKRVPDGEVFAVDIEPGMLRYLEKRAQRERLMMLHPVQASTGSPNLPEPVNLTLVIDTYHHIDDRAAYFSRLRSSLLPGGRVAIVDFKADAPEGPPIEHRIPKAKVVREMEQAGYALIADYGFLPRQYFLVFRVQ